MKRISKIIRYSTIALLSVLLLGLILLCVFQFKDGVSAEDKLYTKKILEQYKIQPLKEDAGFEEQTEFIRAVQHAVIDIAPSIEGISTGTTRNIKDVLEQRKGACYDKSHVMEKIFIISGLKIRHASLYFHGREGSFLKVFFSKGSPSHAVCEVRTKRGWVLVDSLVPLVGIDANQKPFTLKSVEVWAKQGMVNKLIPYELSGNYQQDFFYLYGVYSRNGYLYAPYNLIPDYRVCQLLYNF